MKFDINNPTKKEIIKKRKKTLKIYKIITPIILAILNILLINNLNILRIEQIKVFELFVAFTMMNFYIYILIALIFGFMDCNEISETSCVKLAKYTLKNKSIRNYIVATNKQNRPIYHFEVCGLYQIIENQDRNERCKQRETEKQSNYNKLYKDII